MAVRLSRAWSPISLTARGFIFDAQLNAFTKVGVPGVAAMHYPVRHTISTLEHSAAQLAITAPVLYQEYDRLRSEAEFRIGCTPPIVCLAIVAPLNHKMWLVAAVGAGCLVLVLQAIRQTRSAADILANAAYLGHISFQAVDGLVDAVQRVQPTPTTDGAWIAAIIVAMDRRAQFEEREVVIGELAEFNPTTLSEALEYLRDHYEPLFEEVSRSLDGTRPDHADALMLIGVEAPQDLTV
ncbi:hypothetical protein ACFQZ4_52585 [Catellatospora coxensis]|uniref:hypothetical protein n=1 Tax=Catellatospora coxensis TaxID=310354 RepID=UPI00194422D6|nr:hypothetical protein [Catellatospora coxensis]